ncbi:MAG: hypothetical protein LBH18_00850 [Spirochaetaceae bacterium]|nr:hypothetical protein [Spirochaetaceae bacterium]
MEKIDFSGEEKLINLAGLNNHSVYLVKVNKGSARVPHKNSGDVLNAATLEEYPAGTWRNTVSVTSAPLPFDENAPVSGIYTGSSGETIIRYDFNPGLNSDLNMRSAARNTSVAPPNYQVSDTRGFWTQDATGRKFTMIPATLRATRDHCNIWVADTNYSDGDKKDNTITASDAKELAEKFDIIYEKETAVFGYEYGGGPDSSAPHGGVDGDPKVQIFVYDIFGDFFKGQNGGVFGYFWPGDEQEITNSNKAEIFYIDAHFTSLSPAGMYSTLAHEFQHMIHYNQKFMTKGKNSGIWYNEMLSMLAEDLIDPFIGIEATKDGHPIENRIPRFLDKYFADPTVWSSGSDVYTSYAAAYALGAYLVRNFGGVGLVKRIMFNDEIDIASIDEALNSDVNPRKDEINSLSAALSRYGEALLFNQPEEGDASVSRPSGVLSFNNTVKTDEYEFTGFDLFSVKKESSLTSREKSTGPVIWDLSGKHTLESRSVLLLSSSGWQGVTGDISIKLAKPADPNVELYIIVR